MPITSNPNAEIALYTGAVTVIIVFIFGHFGIDVGAEVGAAMTTVLTGLLLFIGRQRGSGADSPL